jgi:hypothetical protein
VICIHDHRGASEAGPTVGSVHVIFGVFVATPRAPGAELPVRGRLRTPAPRGPGFAPRGPLDRLLFPAPPLGRKG